ncbi:hypothetical protein CDO87_18335 [Sagittula sp. P11]|uniref:hypothetical protein n=1 Tax=Sagittula sp. P11 TaxID=2009329 RepID=UPI000C2D469F|nr:hypothetical protein [Sagittula sp. P11]AUC55007.1 hypothetical protein CDO87_18335 [Sagittula sp. P11]
MTGNLPVLEHRASGRTPWAALALILVWLAILTLWLVLEAAGWIVALLMLVTLPAALDFARDRQAGLRLDDRTLAWRSGGSEGEIALARIRTARFETRLDLSVRARLVTDDGRRITLPQDCLPQPPALEEALRRRNVTTERHHFGLRPDR